MNKKIFIIFLMVDFFLLTGAGIAGNPAYPEKAIPEEDVLSPPTTVLKPKIDGILDDETWKTQPLKKDFITYQPIYGEKLPYKTLVWMTYDSNNLYFAFLCDDGEPQKIKTSLAKRDSMWADDWVGITLDSLGNKQTTYGFCVNPSGIQGDLLESTSKTADVSPDFVWESAGKVTSKGYQVEICIPLKSIQFGSGKEVEMGIMFRRNIHRLGVKASWPEQKAGEGVFNLLVPVRLKELKKPLKFEILPSITHSINREKIQTDEWNKSENLTGLGIGIKYGITSSITAEFTVNPDFSQVESDAFQVEVNQRYPLFYSEKRPFFMEGSDIFNFFANSSGFMPHAVHTRKIVNPHWGVKLTGTTGKASFGILSALDQQPDQNAFFGIARGKYSLGKDNYWGLLYSGREVSGEYNRVVGTDLGYRLFKNQKVNLSCLYSMSGATGDNRSNTENTNSYNFNLGYLYQSRKLFIEAALEHIGKDFRMDSAYLKRTGTNQGWISMGYYLYPDSQKIPWLKVFYPKVSCRYLYDLYTHMDDLFLNFELFFYPSRQGYLNVNYTIAKEGWQEKTYDLNRFEVTGLIQLFKWLGVYGVFSHGESIYYDASPSFKGKGFQSYLSLEFQPNKNINQMFCFQHSDLSRDRERLYDVNIFYSRTTYQFNKYFFLRAILQYHNYRKRLVTDFLASFTFIPGTVLHVGYGGLYESRQWQDNQWLYGQGNLLEIKRSFFLKASYLWRF